MMSDAKAAASELRLKWRHTWPEKGKDYAAEADGWEGTVGRVILIGQGPQEGRWSWSMYACSAEISRYEGETRGKADTPREAALKVEAAWFAAIAGTSHERPVNAYQSAKVPIRQQEKAAETSRPGEPDP